MAAKQRRHLLLVGPPGVGKSMIAQAMSLFSERPKEEVRVMHNPEYPERPVIEIKTATQIEQENEEMNAAEGILIDPENVSFEISERLGFRCTRCGFLSSYNDSICPSCKQSKSISTGQGPFGDVFNVIGAAFGVHE
jgi:Predicted ATP-dependent protease